MKTNHSITTDADVWMIAQQKIPNISDYLNECLKTAIGRTKEEVTENKLREDIKAIDESIRELSIKKGIYEMELKQLQEQAIERKLEHDKIENRRWICPVCSTKNLMDVERCAHCSLPTRNDPKTVVVNIADE